MGEITMEEILERGINLPEDRLSFPIEKFEEYKDDFGNTGGIYTFTHNKQGWLYVGISADLKIRLSDHIIRNKRNNPRGNNTVLAMVERHEAITVTVYKEKNDSLREFYENYLILKHNPIGNKSKAKGEKEGYTLKLTEKQKEEIVSLCLEGKTYAQITTVTGVCKSSIIRVISDRGVKSPNKMKKLSDNQMKERTDKIIKLYVGGDMTHRQIATTLGITVGIVSHTIQSYNRR